MDLAGRQDPMIGRHLSHYQIVEKLGQGGMGAVYRARDLHLDRPVAIKVLRTETMADPKRKKRFVQEAKAASALNHPNIVTIHDIGQAGGVDYIAMEYVQGKTLDQLICHSALALGDALKFATQMADALAKAHAASIIHRDLKPSNIIVTEAGLVKLLDFGLAKLIEAETPDSTSVETEGLLGAPRTAEGTIVGTVAYMSPEQAEGKRLDHRSDIFSFGSVVYEMVTGQRAFQGETKMSALAAILREDPKPLREIVKEVPTEFEKVVARCLRKDPNRRFHHMMDLKVALEDILTDLPTLPRRREPAMPEERLSTETAPSMAVLPFADMSPEKDQEYFCDGITEELINALTKVEGLRVASRTSAFQFKGKAEDIGKIGAQLKARMVLEGSVRKAGDRLRITAQLIKVEDGYHLWSERYDREMKDVFVIQDEITRAVVDALRIKLFGGQSRPLGRRYTENLEAYDLWLRGRYYWNKGTVEGFTKGIEYCQQAIAKDPRYAPAYAGMAMCYAMIGYVQGMSPKEVWRQAKLAAVKALQIDDALAEAHTALGIIRTFNDCEWWEADREFKRTIELNPNYAEAHTFYGGHLFTLGRQDEALIEQERAHELDPLSIAINTNLAVAFYFRREYDQAIEQLEKTFELDRNYPRLYYYLGRCYVAKGMFEEAIATLEKGRQASGGEARMTGTLGYSLALASNRKEAEKLLNEMKNRLKPGDLSVFGIALIYTGLGEKDQAFEWLEKTYQERPALLRGINVDPLFDSLRSDPRFFDLIERMGLPS